MKEERNLYIPHTKGLYIYYRKYKNRWSAQIRHSSGISEYALLYSLNEAIEWINTRVKN